MDRSAQRTETAAFSEVSTKNGGQNRGARRRPARREPFAWLGVGAISLGVGAALATGSAVAYADTGDSPASSSQSDNSSGGSTPGSRHGKPAKSARPNAVGNGPSTGPVSRSSDNKTSRSAPTAAVIAPRSDMASDAPEAPSLPTSPTTPAAPSTPTAAPAPAPAPAIAADSVAKTSADRTKPRPISATELQAQISGAIHAVLSAFGLAPSAPGTPVVNPLVGLLWGASRRTETSRVSLTAGATALTAAAAPASTGSVSYAVTNDWGAGHNAAMTVTAGSTALNGWTVEFDSPAQITNIWNAQITSHVGTHYVISNMAYNAKVAAGQSTSFGYQATPGAVASTPTNLKVNGVAVGTPPVAPTVSIADVSVAEGNSGTSNANFTVSLSGASTTPVTVGYSTANGTATAGSDFTATSGTLTFAPGVTTQTIAVKVTGDTAVESNETFTVALANPSGATIAKASATGTITNDDVAPVPTVSIADVSVAEGNSGTTNANFTVTLSGASTTPVTVGYSTANGTATAGADYTAKSGTLTFAPGVTSQTVAVAVTGDATVEPSETFTVTLANPSGATISRASATGTITNDDVATPTPGNNSVSYAVTNEWNGGYNANMTVNAGQSSLNGWTVEFDSAAPIVNIWNAQITSHVGTHYVISNVAYNAPVAAGQSTSFGYQASGTSAAGVPKNLKVNGVAVTNPPATPTISIADTAVVEGNTGTGNATFTVTLSSASTSPVSVGYATTNGTATAGVDYTATTGTLTFAPGVTTQTVNVGVIGDATYEANETFSVALSNPSGATLSRGTATGTITNDDADQPPSTLPSASIADVSVTEGNGAHAHFMFNVSLSKASTTPVTVQYATANGTATGGVDYVAGSGTVTFAPGVTSQTVHVDIMGDTNVEPDETFTVTLSNPSGTTISRATATGTIINDDVDQSPTAPPSASIADLSVAEGNGDHAHFMFTVTLSKVSTTPVTVQYATANGTATGGVDYVAGSGTVTFAPGVTSQTVHVDIKGDSVVEPNETFTVTLSNPSGATISRATATGTITDDDGAQAPQYVDISTYGMFHGSDHTSMTNAFEGGRTAITTEALVAYNNQRQFAGLPPATIEQVGTWAFANGMTNNAQAWGTDLQGVGLFYAMQGAKVGWIADDKFDPQIVADIERTARLGSATDVMAMVELYGHEGFADFLMDNGYETAFINTLKMEPHYAGWMHDRAQGKLSIEGVATNHDVNHLTVLSHDQMKPFMNDTWDWPQWPALNVSRSGVIEYFQSMVALGNPVGKNLTALDAHSGMSH